MHAERFVQGPHAFRADVLHAHNLAQAGRHRAAQLRQIRQLAGLHEYANLPGEIRTYAGQRIRIEPGRYPAL